MNEAQVKHFIVMERQKGTTIEEINIHSSR